ncbi:MAG: hypothetical protein QOD07_710 [Frankiaceae bacterium]|jgi:hypothetical protein|nr:hypothetical protein [Frankiaceae bacterium]
MNLRRASIATAAAALAAVAGTAAVQAPARAATATVPLGTYAAALPLQPYPTVSSSTDPSGIGFPVTFTNSSAGDGYLLEHVQVTLPAGFTTTGVPTVSAAGWSASVSGNTVSADASSPTNALGPGQSLLLSLGANAPTVLVPTAYTFATSATGVIGGTDIVGDFSNTGSDPQMTVARYANVVTCAPSARCDTGVVGSASDTTARIVTTTGSIQDFLGLSVDQPQDAGCLAISQPSGRSQELTWADIDTSRTLTTTLQIDKSVVNATPNNGASSYGVCYDTGSPAKQFVDHNGHLTSVGWLPMCGTAGLVARQPCITSVHKTGAGDVLVTYTSPGGDPKSIGGIYIPGT